MAEGSAPFLNAPRLSDTLLSGPLASDPRCQHLAALIARLTHINTAPVLTHLVHHTSASALPALAWQFNLMDEETGYGAATSDAARRALIAQSIALHRIKGTRAAVQQALAHMGVRAQIVEWFEQSPVGQPFTFVLTASVTAQAPDAGPLDAQRIAQMRRVVEFWKPASRHFTLQIGLDLRSQWRSACVGSAATSVQTAGALQMPQVWGQSTWRMGAVTGAAASALRSRARLIQPP